ncbi:hypothetical protein TSAR_002158 [Trichomalopsis sarcophagae]|uniref:Uncharacterized protein n=1 Tax=Trichomalopsis sarcophagae TaxID=543379 RepID=A0A232EIH5_9HYME|nr:hypothetical protein TSAR_002158 [Trichomalopsis sarcophagae]
MMAPLKTLAVDIFIKGFKPDYVGYVNDRTYYGQQQNDPYNYHPQNNYQNPRNNYRGNNYRERGYQNN